MRKILERKPLRYLIAGGWNTIFGYGVTVGLYALMADKLHIVLIATIPIF